MVSYQNHRADMANPVDYDTTASMHPNGKSGCILHPPFTEQLWLCADAPMQQTARCSMFFSATEKKGRLAKSPAAMHTFHIFLGL